MGVRRTGSDLSSLKTQLFPRISGSMEKDLMQREREEGGKKEKIRVIKMLNI